MKRPIFPAMLLALLPLAGFAASQRDDYAQQWPLTLQDPAAGAYRVQLDDAVYRSAHLASLGDVEVFNAAGDPLPAALFAAEHAETTPRRQPLPWFPLPAVAGGGADDLELIAERDTDGSVRRIRTRIASSATASAEAGWLIDASALREPLRALSLQWAADAQPRQARYRVEASDDLRDWELLVPEATLVDLANQGKRLQQLRIGIDRQVRYLRLLPLSPPPLPTLTGVEAELAPAPAAADWHWQQLDALHADPAQHSFDFAAPGRYPVAQLDIALPGNSAIEWRVQSRDSAEAPWQDRAGPWVAYQVGAGASRSPPQALARPVRDRYWRLLATQDPGRQRPALRLGYQPETLIFLAQGGPPYALAAGSARTQRAAAPLAATLQALRAQRGPQWTPATATLGAAVPLAGAAALQAPATPRDWKTWLLWALLVGGALLVVGFAFSLLRKPAAPGAG
ncbi:DUF3999 domain-containing protein [Xanthomonas translucens]|uniref:DUF3999 domain-containing protein n=1 Tax=Xanthomonas campestris pv. translucens TaxID=343 RepID=UPI00071E6E30|nr:DUF3999 domain-containing protein [Xanthomonas translucens]AVY65833.1 membrane protein [Xanthomonas translucens pv. undulosa]QEN94549.1 DUF3999 domain-containing protein [Xanthomonas translucens pv. undulosa]UKE51621.1 DUF3999 domain-containing protein [Xanthomonas translucens]